MPAKQIYDRMKERKKELSRERAAKVRANADKIKALRRQGMTAMDITYAIFNKRGNDEMLHVCNFLDNLRPRLRERYG